MIRFLLLILALGVVTTAVGAAADSGPKGDVAALRAAASRPNAKIENIRVVGNYAVLDWIVPPAGGMTAYKRASGYKSAEHWTVIMSGGGAFGASDLIRKRVPSAIAHKLLSGTP